MTKYNKRFYRRHLTRNAGWQYLLAYKLYQLLKPESVIDFGCGIGSILDGFNISGVPKEDLMGIEPGKRSAKSSMSRHIFRLTHPLDLTKALTLDRVFDLGISLEVGEHIREEKANVFVENITKYTTRLVMTTAEPGDKGVDHVNCQPQEYWLDKFEEHGFIKNYNITSIIKQGCADFYTRPYIQNRLYYLEKTNGI